jgi:predicted Zn-dependent protease with MMP-like domain
MTRDAADACAGQVMDGLPEEIAEALSGVRVYVVEGPDDPELGEAIQYAGLREAAVWGDFRGLFIGRQAGDDLARGAFGAIVLNCEALGGLVDVRDTLAHEMGHALGMSEGEVTALGIG